MMSSPSNFICLNPERDGLQPSIELGHGQTLLDPSSGIFTHVNRAGDLQVTLTEVSSVEIADVFDVEHHEIVRRDSGLTHQVHFYGGGTVKVAFDWLGNLTEFVGSSIAVSNVGSTLRVGCLSNPLWRPGKLEPTV
jgi:hypothetical protein